MDNKSTTFILMKIIRDLTYNRDNTEAREQQRRFVNERFERSNLNIDRCIKSSTTDLTELIKYFSDIYNSIEQSKLRINSVRERLKECKNLLLLKRQDIRKLWLLTSEQNALVKLYMNIDELKHVPIRLQFYLSKKLYLHAAFLLLKAKEHNELRLINALSDIDVQIKEERVALEQTLKLELIDQLYMKSCRDTLGNKSTTSKLTGSSDGSDHAYISKIRENRLLRKQLDHDFDQGKLTFESSTSMIVPDKYLLVDIKYSSELYLEVLIQSLAVLHRLNDSTDFIQKQLHEQLHKIVIKTTQHIVDNNFLNLSVMSTATTTSLTLNNLDYLRDLLETCYEQFKLVVKAFEYVLGILRLVNDQNAPVQVQQRQYALNLQQQQEHDSKSMYSKHSSAAQKQTANQQQQSFSFPSSYQPVQFEIPGLFSIDIVWETLQLVLSEVLNEYIDYNNTVEFPPQQDYSHHHHSLIDFSPYLTKKYTPQQRSQQKLFEFQHSAQVVSMTNYFQEQNRFLPSQPTPAIPSTVPADSTTAASTSTAGIYKQYVCKPNYRNITTVHHVLQRIIDDIDQNIKLHSSKRILDKKLTEFIRDRFIGRVIKDIRESAQIVSTSSSTSSPNMNNDNNRFIELIPLVLQKQLHIHIPILQSTYLIYKSCEELCSLVKCLPPYADDFCQAIIDLLFKHRESCQKLFTSIVERPDYVSNNNNVTTASSIYSMEWVRDLDINRHLRTMPAFDTFIRNRTTSSNSVLTTSAKAHSEINENIDNIRYRQTKETETLLINFNRDEMNLDDICTNYKQIKLLANCHESLDWLYYKLSYYFDILEKCLNDPMYLDYLTQQSASQSPTVNTNLNTTTPIRQKHVQHQYDLLKLSRANLEIFSNAMKTILTLSYDMLLVLFLEIRLHCFYHLSLLFRNASHYSSVIDTDPDENILNLNRDLTRLQETLMSSLNDEKFQFLFQGLGFVLATILIRSSPRFIRISETGITKMCRNIFSIEQTLTQIRTIGGGDAELMRAHRYYELLYSRPDDIIGIIEEKGQEYTETDYINLLHLKHRSFPATDFDIKQYENMIKKALHPQSSAQKTTSTNHVNGRKGPK